MKIHLSVDDSLSVFKYLAENDGAQSAFSCPRLKYYKYLHEKYGAKITLYCFMQNGGFSILSAPDKYSAELYSCSSWLSFGFHSKDADADMSKAPMSESVQAFENTASQLKRITGSAPSDTLRLHYFAASPAFRRFLKDSGVNALLAADDDRISYSLPIEVCEQLKLCAKADDPETGLKIYRTMQRLERLDDVRAAMQKQISRYPSAPLIVFTHDQLEQGIARLEEAAGFACENKLEFI